MADKNVSIDITAQDRTKAAFDSVKRNLGDVSGSISGVVSGFAALAGSSVLVALAKNGINAADSLNDLSKSTNINVKDLAGLQLLARQTGTDLDGLAKGINKMSVEMGKDPEKFRALGITATDNTEAFKQFADIFNTLPDINQRNALANAVFGRSWQELAPALSEGGKQIGEIVERGIRLSGITQEIAEQSDKFNDKWAELTTTGALFNRVMAPALPLLNELADSLLRAGQNSGGLATSFSPLAESLKAVMILGANVSFVFETIGMDVARAVENVQLLAKGDFAASRQLGEAFRKDAQQRRQALDDYEKRIMGMGLTGQAGPVQPPVDPAARAAAEANADKFLGPSAGDTALAKAQAKAREQELRDGDLMAKMMQESAAEQEQSMAQTLQNQREHAEEKMRLELAWQQMIDESAAQQQAAIGETMMLMQEEEAAKAEAAQRNYLRLMESLTSERGLLEQDYADKMLVLKDWILARDAELVAMHEKGVLDEFEFNQRRTANNAEYYARAKAIDIRYQEDKTRIEDEAIKKRFAIANVYRRADINAAGFFAGQMADLMQTNSRKLFELGKAGAIAGAVIDTYKAATGAYASLASIPFVGPALGAAAAAAAVAVGMARVNAIRSQQFGGGGGAVGTFSASPNTGLPEPSGPGFQEAPQSPIAPTLQQAPREITFTFKGSGRYTQEEIREAVVPALQEAFDAGVRIRNVFA